jgi:hypothetical protein
VEFRHEGEKTSYRENLRGSGVCEVKAFMEERRYCCAAKTVAEELASEASEAKALTEIKEGFIAALKALRHPKIELTARLKPRPFEANSKLTRRQGLSSLTMGRESPSIAGQREMLAQGTVCAGR